MKKLENKKFGFEKFEIAKLKNFKAIRGGDDTDITITTDKPSTKLCNASDDNSGIRCVIKDILGI